MSHSKAAAKWRQKTYTLCRDRSNRIGLQRFLDFCSTRLLSRDTLFASYALFLEPDFLQYISLVFINICRAVSAFVRALIWLSDFRQRETLTNYRVVFWHAAFFQVCMTSYCDVSMSMRTEKHVCESVRFLDFIDLRFYSDVTSVNLSNLTRFLDRAQKTDHSGI